MTLPQRNGYRIKTPSTKLTLLVSSYWEKNVIRNNAHKLFHSVPVFLKLLIVSVAFFLVWRQCKHLCVSNTKLGFNPLVFYVDFKSILMYLLK